MPAPTMRSMGVLPAASIDLPSSDSSLFCAERGQRRTLRLRSSGIGGTMYAPFSTRLPGQVRQDLASVSRRSVPLGATGLALLLAGCAGFSPDGGLAAVNAITAPVAGYETAALRSPA